MVLKVEKKYFVQFCSSGKKTNFTKIKEKNELDES